ncbi:MAG: dUTP diphosphatase [Hydrogenophaga sp.]|jgi:dUTP pyrophosphatase|nr:dUTP diphosphatase [Hydrogenophaga sp.]
MKLLIKQLHPLARKPEYSREGDANFDIRAVIPEDEHGEQPVILRTGGQAIIRTGLAFEVPPGWVMAIYSRSGHGFKNEIRLSNCVGQIDSNYRGEVMVAVKNDGRARFTIHHGDKIAQARLEPAPKIELVMVDELSNTERGAAGFGSSGR